jgi:serine/threonine protein kinase
MPNKPIDVKKIFAEALEQDSMQARSEYLDQACAEDAKLRQKIESLLRSHGKAGDFLEVPPTDCDMILDAPPLTEGIGALIGPYKLLEEIGEGGMAVVYMAEQERPLRRRVALKIIKAGMDTKQVMARFDAERQALALMDHPNIARVFDAGATETGRPYFVMELVRGLSITKYCDQNKLNTSERLKLFAEVCNAVHHAHQKGIIHRDLKPSNVMVTMNDGVPMPKVIDFGIAKATNQRLTEHTVFTRYAEMIGTPEYMSPEQAEMSAMDVDTRTDIYSLGIVLYELLTGGLPFDPDTLRAAALGEIQRIIREEEPLRPSTRISSLGEAAEEIAARRCTNVDALAKHLSKELEWIPLKAMRKDRTRRYRSASEFADDIQNYLSDSPLLAGPESPLYRLRKTVQKYRASVMAISAVGAALIMGLILLTSLYMNSIDKRRAAFGENLSTALNLYEEGRYQDALKEIETRFDEEEMISQVGLLRAQLLMETGEFTEAEARLDQLTQAKSEIAGAAHSLLAILNIAVDSDKAEQHQKLAKSMLLQTPEAYYLRGMCAASADEAISWLSKALALDSKNYAACKARAFAHESLRHFHKMAEDASVLVALRPKDYMGYALRAVARRETDQWADALKDHKQAIKLCRLEEEQPRLHKQRRETLMRSERYQTALESAQQHGDAFTEFMALTALRQYDQAQAKYIHIAKQGTRPARNFKTRMEVFAFNLVNRGQSLDLPEDIALKSPFHHPARAEAFYRRFHEQGRALPAGGWLGDWSPDGQEIAYTRFGAFSWLADVPKARDAEFGPGNRFIEIMDVKTGNTRQVTRFGLHPIWSPDGKSIAFTDHRGPMNADVWVLPLTNGTPHKLVPGAAVGWSHDSKHIYFVTRPFGHLHSIAVNIPDAKAVPMQGFWGQNLNSCVLSPDRQIIASYAAGQIRIQTFPEGQEVTHWQMPWPLGYGVQLQWHPNGKLVMLNATSYYNQMGMCLFDIERGQATHVFNLSKPWCRAVWSPDGSQLVVDPYSGEARLLEIDPERPLGKALSPALTTEAFLGQLLEKWDERIEADPLTAENYVSRAVVALGAEDYDRAAQDIKRSIAHIQEPNDAAVHAIDHWSSQCLLGKQYAKAEVWALGRIQLLEKFPAYFGTLDWPGHPHAQLVQLHAEQGDAHKMFNSRKRWLQDHALAPGSLAYNEHTKTYTITGSGRKIGDTWDECHFAYKTLEGDGSIVARVSIHENVNMLGGAGVMIRNSLAADAPHVSLQMGPWGWLLFRHRKAERQDSEINYFGAVQEKLTPHWIRLERKGDTITAHHSSDGVHWRLITPDAPTQSMLTGIETNQKVYIGLTVTSDEGPHVAAQANFSEVSTTGTLDSNGPFTVSQDIGFSLGANSPVEGVGK